MVLGFASFAAEVAVGCIVAEEDGEFLGIMVTEVTLVRVYHLDDSGSSLSWVQVGDDIDGVAVGDESGFSVSLSADGKSVAVGSRNNGASAGHARVFSV